MCLVFDFINSIKGYLYDCKKPAKTINQLMN
jgi:hypothetical protein